MTFYPGGAKPKNVWNGKRWAAPGEATPKPKKKKSAAKKAAAKPKPEPEPEPEPVEEPALEAVEDAGDPVND